MKKTSLAIYVGIVTYRSASVLESCLKALKKQTRTPTAIIIWDNFGEKKVRLLAKRYDAQYIQSEKNLGYGSGHNGILHSIPLESSDYYLSINPDAVLDPSYISEAVASAERHNAGWVTGKLYKDKKHKLLYSVGHAMHRDGYAFAIGYDIQDHGQFDSARPVFGAPGATALYRGDMIQALSRRGAFFDPNIFMYYEDVDVDWRAQLQGFSCWYEPRAIAIHAGGRFPTFLEAEVLSNRFMMVLKNAYWSDLLLYNFPRMIFHISMRILVTPATGIRMLHLFLRSFVSSLSQRKSPSFSVRQWFQSARLEETHQPISYHARMKAFFRRKFHV